MHYEKIETSEAIIHRTTDDDGNVTGLGFEVNGEILSYADYMARQAAPVIDGPTAQVPIVVMRRWKVPAWLRYAGAGVVGVAAGFVVQALK